MTSDRRRTRTKRRSAFRRTRQATTPPVPPDVAEAMPQTAARITSTRYRRWTVEEVLARVDGAVERGGYWMGRCPAHADRTPSFTIRQGESGQALLKCFAGCEYQDIVDALDA